MSQIDPDVLQPVTSVSGGVYATRRGAKSINIVQDHKIAEEDDSIVEKDTVDERDVRKKQVYIFTPRSSCSTAEMKQNYRPLEDGKHFGEGLYGIEMCLLPLLIVSSGLPISQSVSSMGI